MTRKGIFWFVALLIIWIVAHVPAMLYGTHDIPLHQSYIGDEQSPVNGALHMLEDKNPLAVRGLATVYYGPVFSVIAVPATVTDLAFKLISGSIHGVLDYKDYILWDWGGIIWKMRLISIVTGFVGLWLAYLLLMTPTVNPRRDRRLAMWGMSLVSFNFYFFEYSSFFRHWIYVIVGLIAQIYLLVRMTENPERTRKYLLWQAVISLVTFGISYLSLLTQIIFLVPLIGWLKAKNWNMVKWFLCYVVLFVAIGAVIVWWNPWPFVRLIGLTGGHIIGADTSAFSSESTGTGFSFGYYAAIIFNNHLPLIIVWIALLWNAFKKNTHKGGTFWAPLLTGAIYFLAFGILSHHEARYILPVIISLIVSTAALFVTEWANLSRLIKIVIGTCFATYLAFHLISVKAWQSEMSAGPAESAEIAASVQYQQHHPQARQLFIAGYLLGYPHTKSAYQDYADNYIYARTKNKTGDNLYQALLTAPPPAGLTLLNAYYVHPGDFSSSTIRSFSKFDRVVLQYQPSAALHLDPDYTEVNLTRLWLRNEWEDRYVILKQ